jgi:hypothetical protein
MPTYLYCILPAGHDSPLPMPTGVGGAPVRALDTGAITAWVESVSDRTVTPTLERVRAHDAVTERALASNVTPLPVRFGQTFDSDDDCRSALAAQQPRLVRDLERVRGMVEMRVLVALTAARTPDVEGDPGTPGRAYMQQLLRTRAAEQTVQAAAATIRERISTVVRPFVRDEASVVASSPTAMLTLSHLVARDDVPGYRAAVEGADVGPPAARILVRGPVAPYQFVSPPA